jgi:hypothetical protein
LAFDHSRLNGIFEVVDTVSECPAALTTPTYEQVALTEIGGRVLTQEFS